jgi:hypothetical protein
MTQISLWISGIIFYTLKIFEKKYNSKDTKNTYRERRALLGERLSPFVSLRIRYAKVILVAFPKRALVHDVGAFTHNS